MKYLTLIPALLTLVSLNVTAKVTPEEASKIGKELTPLGAEMAANEAGTIPAWTGGLNSQNMPKSPDFGRPVNPFADEKPLFTITAKNMADYQDNLTQGQIAMFKKYPDYRMPVYKTHRTVAYPDSIYPLIEQNAQSASLIESGYGLVDFDTTIPFPIPNNGLEVVWNHITRFRGGSAVRVATAIPVQSGGAFVPVKITDRLVWPEYLEGGRDADKDKNVLFYYLQRITAPARLTGTALLIHETIDQFEEARRAWVYNSGQRRVRRAPNVAYDGPGAGTDGLRTTDNYDMYNGSPDRYEWTLKGKKEIYIPYNAYPLLNTELEYDELIGAGHLNPDYLRYELHRVWVVEANIKSGSRHIYSKRTLYIDEDSWGASVIDHFDNRGELWKVSEAHNIQFYDVDTPWMVAETLHDLDSGRYLVTGLSNEEPSFIKWGGKATRKDFTSAALRRVGR
ncbi:DUF1329 domain-containing protein [Shewanella woodyi]|uniref:Outer membrane lipoprotein-sorting protein n=1 Tax=Shewanella woodyi (strain ATCC 51908 / MS32) TaxID=392500 RepID=B1KF57_SHEWM|nr:DUF1329 domain-containing protein [Shewanella woodyi]ACA86598.1 protein of unknown function DUF1329 [Shewanella woodyi ATCC 51908]